MLLEAKAINIESEIELLEYELKIALLNDRFQDAEDIKSDIIELENELVSMGYWFTPAFTERRGSNGGIRIY